MRPIGDRRSVVRVGSEPVLMVQFREFYRQVAQFKTAVLSGDLVPEGEDQEGRPEVAAVEVWKSLLTTLERQALAARRSGGDFAMQLFEEGQYVMAALADEIFLHLDWGGQEAWQSNILEAKLFHSHRAGEEIFLRLEALLRAQDPVYRGLAEVYLQALGLGFQGMYRDQDNGQEHLARYRQRLFDFLFEKEPELRDPAVRLFSQAYASTMTEGENRKLPHLRPWVSAFFLLLLLWVLLSYPIWRSLVGALDPIVERILV